MGSEMCIRDRADNVRIDGAEFKDGLLSIHLYKEELKKETPRKIPIKS